MTQLKTAHSPDLIFAAQGLGNVFSMKDDGKVIPCSAEIKRHRKQRGISQELLADKTGLALKTIRNLESNPVYRCRPVTIDTLATFYKIEPHALIKQDNTQGVQLLTSSRDVIDANTSIAASARKILACTGSRSRDEQHLRQIENTLQSYPDLVHYRVMPFPPFKPIFQEHLLRVLKIRNPDSRDQGYKTTHIKLYTDLVKQPEYSICANETTATVILPPITGIVGEYNTALLVREPALVKGFIAIIKNLCQAGKSIETEEAILSLGLLKEGTSHD